MSYFINIKLIFPLIYEVILNFLCICEVNFVFALSICVVLCSTIEISLEVHLKVTFGGKVTGNSDVFM